MKWKLMVMNFVLDIPLAGLNFYLYFYGQHLLVSLIAGILILTMMFVVTGFLFASDS